MRANVYVDGFNLFNGIKRRPELKWLDLEALVETVFPDDHIQVVHYFTARVKGKIDRDGPAKQQVYLDALGTLPRVRIRFGKFLINRSWAPLAMPSRWKVPILKSEEKGSDVNLATQLLLDACQGACEMAIVVSNDSDLVWPIQVVQEPPFGLEVWVVNPLLDSNKTRMGGTHQIELQASDIRSSQFPDVVAIAGGKTVSRPADWKAAEATEETAEAPPKRSLNPERRSDRKV